MFDAKCVNCHFLITQSYPEQTPFKDPLTEDKRTKVAGSDYSWLRNHQNLACFMGVWDEGYQRDKIDLRNDIINKNREDFCFFFKYHPGMLLPAAKILQKSEADNNNASRDRKLTIYGLWIAACALVIEVILKLVDLIW